MSLVGFVNTERLDDVVATTLHLRERDRGYGELAHESCPLATGRIVDGSRLGVGQLQLGIAERARHAVVVAGQPFDVDEQAEALVETQSAEFGAAAARSGVRMGWQLESVQLLDVGVESTGPPYGRARTGGGRART